MSVGAGGTQGDGDSFGPRITPDAQVISFVSNAGNLVPGDGNLALDVFVRDLARGSIERVNVATDGTEAALFQPSFAQSMSADGRLVAFQSYADNLIAGDGNGQSDVFVRDRRNGTTERVVLPPALAEGRTGRVGAQLSATGRFIAVTTLFTPGCYLIDRTTGEVRLLNKPVRGRPDPDGVTFALTVSRDGRRVAFQSDANDLVAGDRDDRLAVFVRYLVPW